MSRDDLATRQTVMQIVTVAQRIESTLVDSYSRLHAAEMEANTVFVREGAATFRLSPQRCHGLTFDSYDAKLAVEQFRRDVWASIILRLEIRQMLSVSRAKELDRQLQHDIWPAVSFDAVMAFVQKMNDSLPGELDAAVKEIFAWLCPRGGRSQYKTNSYQIGAKVILQHCCETGYRGAFRLCYHAEQQFRALENVFQALDGKRSVNTNWRSKLSIAIGESTNGIVETEYFWLRCFQNGNVHVKFLRQDLVLAFNARAGGSMLPPEKQEGPQARV